VPNVVAAYREGAVKLRNRTSYLIVLVRRTMASAAIFLRPRNPPRFGGTGASLPAGVFRVGLRSSGIEKRE